jgi:hypothetical protein
VRNAAVAAGEPGDGPLDHGSVRAGIVLEGRIRGALTVFALQRVVFVENELASPRGGGAPGPEWTAGAGGAERDPSFGGDGAGDVVRAGHGAGCGQVTVPAASLTVKSSRVNPPSTAGRTGQGLITGV